jgi:hypothetical protein
MLKNRSGVVCLLTAALICTVLLCVTGSSRRVSAASAATAASYAPEYTKDGDLVPPLQYREWIYLTSGLGMSYTPNPSGMTMFDNVFVNPEAYRSFLANGTWPDKTVMVLETRGAESKGSINKSGHFQKGDLMGLEIHVKDEARFPGKWAFFEAVSESKATIFPQTASCYSCHAQHAAVDTTFVQFYPTLLPIAQKKATLSAAYLKEISLETAK